MIKGLIRYSALSLFVAFLVALVAASIAYADWDYASYNGSVDNNSSIYNANWTSQSFLSNVSVPFTNASFLLYRIGTPGTLAVNVYQADDNGKPTGASLSSGSYNADTLTTDTGGETITVSLTHSVGPAGNLSVVLSAAAGSLGNSVEWLMDSTTPVFLNGVVATTNDSGGNWTVNSSLDAIFNVSGFPSYYNISEAKVFRNIFETGGQLFVISYNLTYDVEPNEPPEQLYSMWVNGRGREVNEFGSYMTSIYFNESETPGAWGSTQTATINGSPLWGGDSPSATLNISSPDYIWSNDTGQGRGGLYSYLMGKLEDYSTLWGMNLTYEDQTLGLIPNYYGAQFLERAVPGIASIFPVIGWQVEGTGITDIERIDVSEYEFGEWEYQTELQGNLPAEINTSIGDVASTIGATSGWVKGLLLMIFAFVIGGIVYGSTRDSVMAISFGAVPFVVAPVVGFLDFVWLALAGFLAIVGAAFYIWGVGRG